MKKVQKNALEWTVFAVSLALILAVIGVLAYQHLTDENRPPAVRIETGTPSSSADGFDVPLEVFNDGDVTAEEVEIEVTLTIGGTEEKSTVVLAFVPHGSRRRAWVSFEQDPSKGTLEARVLGYREP